MCIRDRFLVSVFDSATAARCPDPLLPVSEGVHWHPSTRPTTRQNPPGETAASFGSGDYGGWAETDTAITLSARDHKGTNTVAVESFTGSSHAQYTDGVGTLRANGGDLGGGSETLIAFTKGKRAQTPTDDETWDEGRPAPTLNQFDQGDTRATTIITEQPNMAVRRLTPLECERLMGWPDNWTDGQADSHRYKQCGNGVASPVAQWIAEQLLKIDQ